MFDSSGSARKNVPGTNISRIDMAKRTLRERNQVLPNLGYNAGLYLYTPFKPVYKMQPYDPEKFAAAIDSLPNHGNSPTLLFDGLVKIEKVLSGLKGHTVIAIFTDGTYSKGGGHFRPNDRLLYLKFYKHDLRCHAAQGPVLVRMCQPVNRAALPSPESIMP